MDLVGSALLATAVISLGLGLMSSGSRRNPRLLQQLIARSTRELAEARIRADPRQYLVLRAAAPIVLVAIGWLQSPVLALGGAAAGLLVPRGYVAWLVHERRRQSEAEAGRLLQSFIAGLSAGGTYLDALREARSHCTDDWTSHDLDLIIQRFLLDAPLHITIKEVRGRTTTRNLGLIWETLGVCTENHLPTQKARDLLLDVSGTVQFNVQMVNEVRARSAGQRAQIWLLAVIVPGMFLYLRWVSPELLSMLDTTFLGRLILFPLAVALQLGGIIISFRVAGLQG